jgi:hypothetical protein
LMVSAFMVYFAGSVTVHEIIPVRR